MKNAREQRKFMCQEFGHSWKYKHVRIVYFRAGDMKSGDARIRKCRRCGRMTRPGYVTRETMYAESLVTLRIKTQLKKNGFAIIKMLR